MKWWTRIQSSSKWQLGTLSLLWVLFQPWLMKLGLTEDQFTNMLYGIWTVIAGQAAADFGKDKT